MLAYFPVVFKVLAGLVIQNGQVSHSLCQFFLQSRHFFLALSLKGTGDEFFDWLIIPHTLPIKFTIYWIGGDGGGRGIGRKRNSSDPSDSDSVELPTPLPIPICDLLDRNAPCASDSVASLNQP